MAVILAAVLFPAQLTIAAGPAVEIFFDSAEAVNSLESVSGCNLSFDENESSMFVLPKGASASAVLPLDGYRASLNYAVVTYRVPRTNSGGAAKMTLDFQSGGKTALSKTFYYSVGYKYYSSVVDISTLTSADSVKISFLNGASYGDSIHVYGIFLCETRSEADIIASEMSLAATGDIISRYSESVLASGSYVQEDYMTPYWDADIIFNENVYPLLNRDGTIDDITLMYDASRIVSVKNYGLTTEYREGFDYELVDGKLRILTSGSIPLVKYSEHYYTYSAPNTYAMIGGGYVRFQEGTAIPSVQLAITYVHEDEWGGPVPENKGESLPRTREKLEKGQDLHIVFFGDSITNGGNSSGDLHMAPYADTWVTMLEKELNTTYPYADIRYDNTSVSGGSVETMVENLEGSVIAYNPDLLIIALGTNDYQFKYSTSKVLSEMQYVVDQVKRRCPQCEIIIVSPMLSNPECFDRNLLYEYREGYRNIVNSYDGMALADVTEIHDYLLTRKSYTDMSANNLCHLNDFFARVYGHVIMKTITADGASDDYKTMAKIRLGYLANESLYFENEVAQIRSIREDARAKIDAASSFEEIRGIIYDAKTIIRALPQKREAAENTTDFSRITFESGIYTALFGSSRYVNISHDANESAAVLTVTNANDPYTSIIYSDRYPIGADENKYVVFTYKSIVSNPSRATQTELFFRSGSQQTFTDAQKFSFAPMSDGQYHSVVIDLSGADWWTGAVRQIRIDPFTSCASGDSLYVYSLSLCTDAAQADRLAFLNERNANGTAYDIMDFDSEESLSAFAPLVLEGKAGDIDANGYINALDLMTLKLSFAGAGDRVYSPFYDVNLDGRIDANDALQLRLITAGAVTAAEVESELPSPDISYDEEFDSALIECVGTGFTLLSHENTLEDPGYVAVIYKVSEGDSGSADIYFGEKITPDFKTTVDIEANEIYNYTIIGVPDGASVDKIIMSLSDISIFVDSIGFFENEETARNFASARLAVKNYVPSTNVVLTFTDETAGRLINANNTAFEYSNDTGVVKFTVTGNGLDPYIYFDLADLEISADKYKYIVYEYMVPATNSEFSRNGQLFLCAGSAKDPAENSSKKFDVARTGRYDKKLFDMTGDDYWHGSIYGIRIDYFQAARQGDVCYVKSITFCETMADVNELLNS